MKKGFEVEWTGTYPSLCMGEWIVKYNGVKYDLPDHVKRAPMGTFKEYSEWFFDDDLSEEWREYEDGLVFEEWFLKNRDWLFDLFKKINIQATTNNLIELYNAIQKEDWRHGSCGGCI